MKILFKTILIILILLVWTVSGYSLTKSDEAKRQKLVAEELAKYKDKVLIYNASNLVAKDQKFLKIMLEVAEVVEEINMLQINPENLNYKDKVYNSGTDNDKKLFHRNQGPWCLSNDNPLCNALPNLPKREISLNFWPDDMKEDLLKDFEDMQNSEALLSPFTYVKKTFANKCTAIPFSSYPIIKEHVKKLAKLLKQASNYTNNISLKKFLRSRAKAFQINKPFPYDASDFKWIDLDSDWEITIGPYETYKEPIKKKAQFEIYIGRINKEVDQELKQFKKYLQDFENHFAKFIGKELYKPKKLDKRISIRAIDLIFAAGDARSSYGATVAFHLPNRGRPIEQGIYKKVMLINHMKLFAPLMQKRAKIALDNFQSNFVNEKSDIMNTTFHEFMHGFGANEDMQIISVAGENTTVGRALGSFETLIEELKADVGSLWFLAYLVEKGLLNKKELNKRYATAVMHMLGSMQYALKGTYPQLAAIEIGSLMDKGALVYDQKNGKFKIVFNQMHKAIEGLLKRVVTIQLTGDKEGAKNLREQYVNKIDDDQFELSSLLKEPIQRLKEKFNAHNLESFAVDYKVEF